MKILLFNSKLSLTFIVNIIIQLSFYKKMFIIYKFYQYKI